MSTNSEGVSRRERAEQSIILALFAAFSTFFFIPFDLFISNITDIMLPVKGVMTALGVVSAAVFAAVFFICFLTKGKGCFVCSSLVFALSLGFYIQSSFLSINMGTLDGRQYSPGIGKAAVNTIFWICLICAVFVLHKKFPQKYVKVSSHAAAAVIAVETVTIVVSFMGAVIQDDGGNVLNLVIEDDMQYVCSYIDWDTYSSEENVIIILTDEYDSFCFDDAAEKYPETLSEFDGFTYYKNTLGMYGASYESVAYITTGNRSDVPDPYANDTFFKNMKENYRTCIYSANEFFTETIYKNYAENYTAAELSAEDIVSIGKVFCKAAMYKGMPEIFKGAFWMYSDSFNAGSGSSKYYYPDNLSFYNNLTYDLTLTDEKCFKFIYLYGLHDPRNISADLQRMENWSVSPEEQAVAVNKILNKYFDILKNSGIYDKSQIIVLADHGIKSWDTGKYPLLMYKPFGAAGEGIAVSNAPVSYEDMYPTLIKISGGEPEGRTIFDIGEDEVRERYFDQTKEYITGNIK